MCDLSLSPLSEPIVEFHVSFKHLHMGSKLCPLCVYSCGYDTFENKLRTPKIDVAAVVSVKTLNTRHDITCRTLLLLFYVLVIILSDLNSRRGGYMPRLLAPKFYFTAEVVFTSDLGRVIVRLAVYRSFASLAKLSPIICFFPEMN